MVKEVVPPGNETAKKRSMVPYFVVIILLVVSIVVLGYVHLTQKKEMQEMNTILTEEKDSLSLELNKLIVGYDTLKTNNDMLNEKIAAEQDKIRQLLALQASNAQLIRKYKNELSTLREIMKSYIVQIDSLNTRNKLLTAENIDVKSKLRVAEDKNVELSKIKDELSSKVEIASVVLAKDIVAIPINDRGKEMTRINRISQIRVCFTLRENPIAPSGSKTVFLRIIRPDELILASSADDLFPYQGEMLVYSARRDVEYLNKDVEMCIFWDNDGQLIEGTYTIDLYLEGYRIGTSTFLIK